MQPRLCGDVLLDNICIIGYGLAILLVYRPFAEINIVVLSLSAPSTSILMPTARANLWLCLQHSPRLYRSRRLRRPFTCLRRSAELDLDLDLPKTIPASRRIHVSSLVPIVPAIWQPIGPHRHTRRQT